jgi:hypothetical protein
MATVLEEILDACEKVSDVSHIKFDLYLKYSQHTKYFPHIDNLTIHIIPKSFISSIKSTLVRRMKKSKRNGELCIGLEEEAVESSVDTSNFILFLKIDNVPEGVVIGNINDSKRKSMIFIDILCSNPIKYSGIGKHLLDFFKYIIFLNCIENPEAIHSSMHLKSVNSKNTINFYERNGMRNIEDETEGDDDYPYIWKISYLEDIPDELIEYKINDGIRRISPRRFSGRRKAIYKDVISTPSVKTRSRKSR